MNEARAIPLALLLIVALTSGGCQPSTGGALQEFRGAEEEDRSPLKLTADVVGDAPESGWGHLQGQFLLDKAPAPAKFEITKDAAFCGKFDLADESLLVDKDGGLANVVVWLSPKTGEAPPLPHASYSKAEDARILLDNKDCRFVPRVVLLRTTQTLAIRGSDPAPVSHNANIASEHNPISPNLAPGETVERQFRRAERLPAPVTCGSHPWMKGWLVIKDTPYMAVSDAQGRFAIANLPAGKWGFQFWHERLGLVRTVEIDGAAQAWPRGRKELSVESGRTTDLGRVRLKLADYQ